jgi:hypothetical protein
MFPRVSRSFGAELVRAAVSTDRRAVYVVGDSVSGGLMLSVFVDAGRNWRVSRIAADERASPWRYPTVTVGPDDRVHVIWMEDRDGSGAIYNAYSDDRGVTFSAAARVCDAPFPFPAGAPAAAHANQDGTWIGDYLSATTVGHEVVVAWSDQRRGTPQSVVYVSVGQVIR